MAAASFRGRGRDRRVGSDALYDGTERRSARGRRGYEVASGIQHLLQPLDSQSFLGAHLVLARIGQAFRYVETDDALGRSHIRWMIETIRDESLDDTMDHDERVRQLNAVIDDAMHVRCGDDPSSDTEHLSVYIVPHEPLVVDYDSLAHQMAAHPLVLRLAKALNYIVVQREARR